MSRPALALLTLPEDLVPSFPSNHSLVLFLCRASTLSDLARDDGDDDGDDNCDDDDGDDNCDDGDDGDDDGDDDSASTLSDLARDDDDDGDDDDGDDDDGDGDDDDGDAPPHSPTWRGSPEDQEKPSRVLFHQRILWCQQIFEEGRSS